MADLLLEIFSEEIPAKMQIPGLENFVSALKCALENAHLQFEDLRSYVTPRRMVVSIRGLPLKQPDIATERKGPNVEANDKAIQGFLKSVNAEFDQCEQRVLPKGTFLFYSAITHGRETAEVLSELIGEVLDGIVWPKSMNWGSLTYRWVRPVRSILCIFDGDCIPFSWGGVTSGVHTFGHRTKSRSKPLKVNDFVSYEKALRQFGVMLDHNDRRQYIYEEAQRIAQSHNLNLFVDEALLTEVAGLVEWPTLFLGRIDSQFMSLPSEVLTASIRTNQKYLTFKDASGAMAPYFIIVANNDHNGDVIIAGNERVLRARLSDAQFFWNNDRKKPLESFLLNLQKMHFHVKLGSLFAKVQRLSALVECIYPFIPSCDRIMVARAAYLAKSDLTTEMVFEFPEVQGIMGSYYALQDGVPKDVAQAIAEHYSPMGPHDMCPTHPISIAISLIDKIDTLSGFWIIGEKPNGSKDPFALRRAALGVIRIIIENNLRVPLRQVLEFSLKLYESKVSFDMQENINEILVFFVDRLKVYLKKKNIRNDVITAVFALGDEDDLVRLLKRVDSVQTFLETPQGANVLAAYKRAARILRIEEKNDNTSYNGTVNLDLLKLDIEKNLYSALNQASNTAQQLLQKDDFIGAMEAFSEVGPVLDEFFTNVIVNDSVNDIRCNRLNVLAVMCTVLCNIADLSLIVV